jgi:hypothetical protein
MILVITEALKLQDWMIPDELVETGWDDLRVIRNAQVKSSILLGSSKTPEFQRSGVFIFYQLSIKKIIKHFPKPANPVIATHPGFISGK